MDEQESLPGFPPARSVTNKVARLPTTADACDVLSFDQRREMDRLERLYAGVAPTPSPLETAWRHRHWLDDRGRVFSAMRLARLPGGRLERFNCCGAGCVVEAHRDTGQMRVRGFYCGDRFCQPCSQGRAARYRRQLTAWLGARSGWMFTLTLRHRRETLTQMLDRLIKHFAAIRRLMVWRRMTLGGVWTVEIKRGAGSGRWHVHIHGLACGPFVSEDWLRRAWRRETRDSFKVKIRRVTDVEKGAAYVCKYITKGWSADVARCPDDLVECLRSLGGRRLLATFGADRPPELEDDRPDPARWKPLGRLVEIIRLAGTGDVWAVGILTAVGGADPDQEGPTLHRDPAPAPAPSG